MDPKYNGQFQRHWNWLIATYLFLGGIGAGAYSVAALNLLMGKGEDPSTAIGLWISFPAVLVGCLALLADLGSPARAVLAGARPRTSWIARGFWIISAFMVVAFIHAALFSFTPAGRDPASPGLVTLGLLGLVLAIGTMAYTGILLGASKGIPFWRTGVVPVVFVVSAVVTGHFTVMLGTAVLHGSGAPGAWQTVALEGAGLVVVEVLAIAFFLQAAFRTPDSKESALRILSRQAFVIGYFVLGLGAPLVLMLYLGLGLASPGSVQALVLLGGVLGLAGGLILRQSILVCGALPTLNVGGFEFRRVARPREPRPGIGMLPPQ